MTGIIHFSPATRISRRAVVAGAAGLALAGSAGLRAQTPEASPMARGGTYKADARDRLRDLLALLPASAMRGEDPSGQLFDWVDFDAQFAALGLTDPNADDGALVSATLPLYSSDPLLPYFKVPEIPDLLGFRPLDVHQVLVAGTPPDRVLFYRGGLDTAGLPALWEAAGYERKSGTYGEYWTTGEQGEVDLTHPIKRMVMANLNNIAILDDFTIVTASFASRLETVLALAAGEGDAAASDGQLEQVIAAMPADAVNVVALPGEAFLATGIVPENPGMDSFTTVEELLAESNDAVGPMPALGMALCGVTAGARGSVPEEGTPDVEGAADAHAFMMFLTASEEDARTAAEIAYWRLENMTSPTTGAVYSELFIPADPVEEAIDGQVMTVRFTGERAVGGAWRNMILSRDSWPFAWLPVS